MNAPAHIHTLAEQAADWDIRLRSAACTAADREAFAAWCAADPAHAEAFDGLQLGIGALKEAYATSPRLRAMRDQAHTLKPQPQPWRIAAGVAAGVLAVGALGGFVYTQQGQGGSSLATMELPRGAPSVYQTAVGERTDVTLSDGSVVTLNTQSRLVVNYTAGRRDVTLVAGQALFDVAKNAHRPFVVTAGSRQVTALGTAFDVRLDRKQVRVTLIEGKVKVEPARGSLWRALPMGERDLAPGQQLVASNTNPVVSVAAANVAVETSWREGVVVFNDTPLAQAVAEMNRYADEPITVGDRELGELRINGRFRTNEPGAFLGAVVAYFPVEAHRTPGGETVLTGRP
ncbi:MAG TPA: FecR family protein [Caulobacteraceae bacterium]|nr:FecR family protein [Caulobacteraceae bacterium]